MNYEINLPSKIQTVSEEGAISGVYEISGLQPGYGYTLGNSLRRIILSSLPGAAITSVKIDGVNHEFSAISGIKEDVITIISNLKQVRFIMHSDEPQTISFSVKGVKKVKAKDFKLPTQVEIVNGDLEIANLTSKDSSLFMEARIEKGLGYVPREILHKDKVDVGTITMDAIFTPIRKVNYEVENMRVGERTDYNKLIISVETDGTISAREALKKAVEILIKQFSAIADFGDKKDIKKAAKTVEAEVAKKKQTEITEEASEKIAKQEEPAEDPLKIRIEDLNLSPRILSALSEASIRTIGGIVKKKEEDLVKLDGIGEKAIQEIRKAIGRLGLTLKE